MKKFYILALVAAMFAACATDATEDVAIEAPETLKVSFEESSRIQLDDNKTVWTKGDLVSVFYRSDANQQWKFQGNTGDRSGTIKRVSTPEYSHTTSKMVVAYPYNENYYLNPETCNLQAFLPAEQTYLKDSYGINGNIMVSQSEYKQFVLKSVCGWLKIQLTGNGEKVQSIKLKGNNGEQVAGEIYVNTADATSILAAEMGSSSDDTQVGGTMVEDDTILTEVTLNCPNGVTLSSTAKAFYIALPPQTFANGLSVEVSCSDESVMTKSTDSSITIERNTIQPMAALTYDGVVPEVYELVYTTNDGQPLDPYTTEGFGANFVENTYDATTGIGSLKFDAQMTYIPDRAFVGCSNLTSINLTKQIKKIGIEAFNGCSALAVMEIPGSVYSIGDKAFYHCSGMQEITIPKGVSIGVSSFEGCSGKANINCSIPYGYLAAGKFYKANFNEVVLGEGITSIGSWGFYYCSNIKKITIPNSLTYIDDYVFDGCGNIEQVNISSLESWCRISFEDGTAHPAGQNTKLFLAGKELNDVVIPESVTNIAPYAFYNIESIRSVTIHDKVSYIGEFAFYKCNNLSSVTIGNRVTSIGTYAFNYCTNLSSITIGNRVTSIGTYAFTGCSSLKEVYYTGNLSDWCKINFDYSNANPMYNGAKLYLNGVELTEATIPSDITEIKDYTFYGCTSLRSVTIPDSVTSIGRCAFYYCTLLTSVTIPDSVTSIGEEAFSHCNSLKEVYYNGDLSAWCKIDFYDNKANPLSNGAKLYLNGVELTEATIPSNVTEIKDNTFYGCTSLTSITIPDSVTSIGSEAFYSCSSLTSVTIPDSVTEIKYRTFGGCTSLTSVTIGDSVYSIGGYAFYNCTSLTSVTIPDSVTSIGSSAFYDCTSLKEVYCKPTTPPSGGSSMFSSNASGRKIYVPRASVDAYKAAQYWRDYKSYIEPYDFE